MAMPSSSRQRPQQSQSRYVLPSNDSGIKRNTSDPKISSSLRSQVITADSFPNPPAPAIVKRGPMPELDVAPLKVEKQKRRTSIFGSRKKSVVAAA